VHNSVFDKHTHSITIVTVSEQTLLVLLIILSGVSIELYKLDEILQKPLEFSFCSVDFGSVDFNRHTTRN